MASASYSSAHHYFRCLVKYTLPFMRSHDESCVSLFISNKIVSYLLISHSLLPMAAYPWVCQCLHRFADLDFHIKLFSHYFFPLAHSISVVIIFSEVTRVKEVWELATGFSISPLSKNLGSHIIWLPSLPPKPDNSHSLYMYSILALLSHSEVSAQKSGIVTEMGLMKKKIQVASNLLNWVASPNFWL